MKGSIVDSIEKRDEEPIEDLIAIVLPAATHKALAKEAFARNTSVGKLISAAVSEYLRKEVQPGPRLLTEEK